MKFQDEWPNCCNARITDTTQTFIATLYVIHLLRYEHKREGSGHPLEIVLFLRLVSTATRLWKKLSNILCTVQCMLLVVLLYLPLLPTYCEKNGFWLRTRKRLDFFLFGSPDFQFQSNVRLFEQV